MKVSYFDKIRGVMHLHRAVALVWESARSWTIAGLGLMVIQSFLPLLTLYLIKLIVDAVTAGISSSDKSAALRDVMLWIGLAGLATILTAGCRALENIVREHQSHLVTDHVTDIIHRQSAAVDLAYYDNANFYDTLHRTQYEAAYRPNRIVNGLTNLGQNGFSLLAMAGLIFYLHWAIALILFAAVLPGIVFKMRHADRHYEWKARRTETERKIDEYHHLLIGGHPAKELRLFNLSELFRDRYRNFRETLRGERLQLEKTRSFQDLIAQAGAVAALFGMLAYIAWRTIHGAMTLGDMVMYYQAFQRAQGYLQGIMSGLAGLYEDSIFLNYFYAFLDLKPQTVETQICAPVPHPMKSGIALENVFFKYPTVEENVLRDINLTIRPGEVVALVGDNGSGKTTLAKLLCRLYDPSHGRVTMDGTDFRDFHIQALRREITVIFQDYLHYPLTARENIWIGDIKTNPDDERVHLAAGQSGADKVISHLPYGYETILSNRFEKGVELSIGEWQKIALARAFMRDAQLLILDEPTSSLSAQAEHDVFEAFKKLLKGRSALLISHRFSSVRMADLICVLEKGEIIESGSHDELIRRGGQYAHMYEIQASRYR
ncbi:MAG: ABC transporter ATP-binding protein [Smithella sp.]